MRTRSLALSLAAFLSLPASLAAQAGKEPERTKELKEAEKFYMSAMLAPDTVERKSRLARALNPLQQALAKDAGNARVWLMAGQVYAGLREYARADSAFDKAEQLYPAITEETTPERLHTWADIFNLGVASMDAAKYDDAIALMESAENIYPGRPESKMNLGALYANKSQNARAEDMFRTAIALLEGPARESLKPEEAAQWKRYAELARINVASIIGQRGVDAFQAEHFDEASAAFRDARAMNPQSRDYSYNLAQSLYAKAGSLEEKRVKLLEEEKAASAKKDAAGAQAKAAESKRIAEEINTVYAEIEPLVTATRVSDPNNEDLFLLLMRSFRIRGEVVGDPAAKTNFQKRGDELLKLHDAMAVEVASLNVAMNGADAAVHGRIRNIKLAPGTPVKIHVTLLGLNGAAVGDQVVLVNAPAANATADFDATVKVNGDIAGWKYVIE